MTSIVNSCVMYGMYVNPYYCLQESDKQTKELLETLIKENSSAFEGDEDSE